MWKFGGSHFRFWLAKTGWPQCDGFAAGASSVYGVYTCTNRIYLKLLIMRNPFTYLISSLFVGQLEVVVFLECQIPRKIPLSFHCIHNSHTYFPCRHLTSHQTCDMHRVCSFWKQVEYDGKPIENRLYPKSNLKESSFQKSHDAIV